MLIFLATSLKGILVSQFTFWYAVESTIFWLIVDNEIILGKMEEVSDDTQLK